MAYLGSETKRRRRVTILINRTVQVALLPSTAPLWLIGRIPPRSVK